MNTGSDLMADSDLGTGSDLGTPVVQRNDEGLGAPWGAERSVWDWETMLALWGPGSAVRERSWVGEGPAREQTGIAAEWWGTLSDPEYLVLCDDDRVIVLPKSWIDQETEEGEWRTIEPAPVGP